MRYNIAFFLFLTHFILLNIDYLIFSEFYSLKPSIKAYLNDKKE